MSESDISAYTAPVRFWEHRPGVDYRERQNDVMDRISEIVDEVEYEGDILIAFRVLLPYVTADGQNDVEEHFVFWTTDPTLKRETIIEEFIAGDHKRMSELLLSWFDDPEDGNVRGDGDLYHLLFIPSADEDLTAPCIDVMFRLAERNDSLFAAIGENIQELWELWEFERVQHTTA